MAKKRTRKGAKVPNPIEPIKAKVEVKAKAKKEKDGKVEYRKTAGSLFLDGKFINAGEKFWAKPESISKAFMDSIEEVNPKKK